MKKLLFVDVALRVMMCHAMQDFVTDNLQQSEIVEKFSSLEELCVRELTEKGRSVLEMPVLTGRIVANSFNYVVKLGDHFAQMVHDDTSGLSDTTRQVLRRQFSVASVRYDEGVGDFVHGIEKTQHSIDVTNIIEYMAYAQRLGLQETVAAYQELLDQVVITSDNVHALLVNAQLFHAGDIEARCVEFLTKYYDGLAYHEAFIESAMTRMTDAQLQEAFNNPVWWCDVYDERGNVDRMEVTMIRVGLNALRTEQERRVLLRKTMREGFARWQQDHPHLVDRDDVH